MSPCKSYGREIKRIIMSKESFFRKQRKWGGGNIKIPIIFPEKLKGTYLGLPKILFRFITFL